MRPISGTVVLVLAVTLAGCGGGAPKSGVFVPPPGPTPGPTSNPVPVPNASVALNENWHFQSVTDSRFSIDGAFGRGSGKFEGAAYINDSSSCFWIPNGNPGGSWFAVMPLYGTIDDQGQISMHSDALNGKVLALTGSMSSDGTALTAGQYEITGCGDAKAGEISGMKYKFIDGTYRGIMTLNGEELVTTVELKQGAFANPFPFQLTGTVTISGAGCSESWALGHMSRVYGKELFLYSDDIDVSVYGAVDPDALNLEISSYPYTDDCSAGATGTLHKQ
ncbi:MAG TPA: hypothetical protein VF135_04510 [Terriglobales bacterium]